MTSAKLTDWAITRFEFQRDRLVGDSQVAFDRFHGLALEIKDTEGRTGLGFAHTMHDPMPKVAALEETFLAKLWPRLDGTVPQAVLNGISRPRGGNQYDADYGFGEAVQIALWDLASQQAGLPLARYLGATEQSVPAYASGLDYHLSDAEFQNLFSRAADAGFTTFKIKVGNSDPDWDLHRLDLLKKTVGAKAGIMVDANEAWSPKEAATRINLYRKAGHGLIWVEDPILRSDVIGLKSLCQQVPWTMINSGEYLESEARANLVAERATDIVNLHGRVSDTMRIGWLAAQLGLPVALGNTTLETGVHAAVALPNAAWIEYSFQNYDHLIDTPVEFRNSRAFVPNRPGIGFALSQDARDNWSAPNPLTPNDVRLAPSCRFMVGKSNSRTSYQED